LGPLQDEANEKVTEKRRNKLPQVSQQQLDEYMDFLMDYFKENWGDE
jgi:hypothetical protein